jgi:hypothetical protein
MENENAPVTAKRALNRAFIQSNLFPWTNLANTAVSVFGVRVDKSSSSGL